MNNEKLLRAYLQTLGIRVYAQKEIIGKSFWVVVENENELQKVAQVVKELSKKEIEIHEYENRNNKNEKYKMFGAQFVASLGARIGAVTEYYYTEQFKKLLEQK